MIQRYSFYFITKFIHLLLTISISILSICNVAQGECPNPRPEGDIYCDGIVNVTDFAFMHDAWMSVSVDTNYNPDCDYDKDDNVDLDDLKILGANWLDDDSAYKPKKSRWGAMYVVSWCEMIGN